MLSRSHSSSAKTTWSTQAKGVRIRSLFSDVGQRAPPLVTPGSYRSERKPERIVPASRSTSARRKERSIVHILSHPRSATAHYSRKRVSKRIGLSLLQLRQ